MQRARIGFTLAELLAVTASAVPLIAVAIPTLAQVRGRGGTLQDAAQILEIHAAFLQFAADGDGTLPTPGLINTQGSKPGGPQNYSENKTANVYSSMIAQEYITTEVVVGPTEVNPVVQVDKDYDFNAYDPRNDSFWDRTFAAAIWGTPPAQEANFSYAHLAVCGKRRDLKWRDTGSASDPILGTRGVKDGVGQGNPEYDLSPTLLLHGDPAVWEGNICFSDHHLEFVRTFFPVTAPFALGADGNQGDNIFRADDDRHPGGPEAGADAWLVIVRSAHPDGNQVSETYDRLLD